MYEKIIESYVCLNSFSYFCGEIQSRIYEVDATESYFFQRYHSFGRSYAFDYFICNRDRTQLKPNLLIEGDDAVLIDHEMALEINEQTFANLETSTWDARYRYHLFYEKLKNSSEEQKEHFFEDFLFYLRECRWNKFDGVFEQLQELGFETHADMLKKYFQNVQQNAEKFVGILKKSIE